MPLDPYHNMEKTQLLKLLRDSRLKSWQRLLTLTPATGASPACGPEVCEAVGC